MNIIRKNSDKYGLQKEGKIHRIVKILKEGVPGKETCTYCEGKTHRIVKILKEYEKEQDAVKDMTRLLTGEITEQELIEGEEG